MNLDKEHVLSLFPAKDFRKYQRETVEKIVDELNTGVKCILLDAPTGFGKSPVNITFCRAFDNAFYTTPQLTLIDQIQKDKLVGKYVTEIKGRQNYVCKYDPAATTDIGLCKRLKDFSCQKVDVCPYWIQKLKALKAHTALMSFSYFLLEGRTETDYSFKRRELLVLDESHSIDRHVINHISLTVSPWSITFDLYKKFSNLVGNVQSMSDVISLVSTIKDLAEQSVEEVVVQTTLTGGELSITQATNNRRLEDFISNADMFLNSEESTEWVWQITWTSYHGNNYPKLIVQPLYAREFMLDMIWSRANYYIVSSATLLNIPIFVHETGLDKVLKKDEILHINIPSTFPPENRPIIDRTNGKLTRSEREKNIYPAVKILERILDQESGNVAVHLHSYEMLISVANLIDSKYKERLVTHTPETRQEALELWKNSHGKVFLCVSFEEGQDWYNPICDAQVLFKVPYLDTNDKRVEARLEKRNWSWYYNETLKTVIQSYGRAVRSPTDKARYYVIDASFIDLIRRCKKDVPAWIKEVLPEHWRKLLE
jgi:Rad3-related DNA helicase